MTLTIQQLDALAEKHLALPPAPPESKHTSEITVVSPSPIDNEFGAIDEPKFTARYARHQVLGAMKLICRMSGQSMVTEVAATELFVERVNELEAQSAAKDAHIARLEKALANISAVLELHAADPFELKPISKWNKGELGKWMIEAADSMKWAMTRAENELVPERAVPLIAGPKD